MTIVALADGRRVCALIGVYYYPIICSMGFIERTKARVERVQERPVRLRTALLVCLARALGPFLKLRPRQLLVALCGFFFRRQFP